MKQIVVIVGVITFLTGCVTSQKRMDINAYNHFKVDCTYAETQKAFVALQQPTRQDRINSTLATTGAVGVVKTVFEGSFNQHMATRDGRYTAISKTLEHQLNRCDPNYVEPNVCDLAFPESPACQRYYSRRR